MTDFPPLSFVSYEGLQSIYNVFDYGFGVPVIFMNALIIYIIIKHSPSEMKIYSRLLLNQTIWELITVIFNCFLFQPIFLFPYAAFVVSGPIRLLQGVGALAGFLIYVQLYGQCLVSVTACFVYRYQKVANSKSFLFSYRMMFGLLGCWYLSNSVLTVSGIMAADYSSNLTLQGIIDAHPEWSSISKQYVVIFPRSIWTIIGLLIIVALALANSAVGILLFFLIKRKLNQTQSQISVKTYRMHRNLTFALLLQVLSPIVCMITPLLFGNLILRALHLQNEVVGAVTMNSAVYYHLFSGIATLYFVKPYRKALLDYTRKLCHPFGEIRRKSMMVHPAQSAGNGT